MWGERRHVELLEDKQCNRKHIMYIYISNYHIYSQQLDNQTNKKHVSPRAATLLPNDFKPTKWFMFIVQHSQWQCFTIKAHNTTRQHINVFLLVNTCDCFSVSGSGSLAKTRVKRPRGVNIALILFYVSFTVAVAIGLTKHSTSNRGAKPTWAWLV